jgi:hypothetical protein
LKVRMRTFEKWARGADAFDYQIMRLLAAFLKQRNFTIQNCPSDIVQKFLLSMAQHGSDTMEVKGASRAIGSYLDYCERMGYPSPKARLSWRIPDVPAPQAAPASTVVSSPTSEEEKAVVLEPSIVRKPRLVMVAVGENWVRRRRMAAGG